MYVLFEKKKQIGKAHATENEVWEAALAAGPKTRWNERHVRGLPPYH